MTWVASGSVGGATDAGRCFAVDEGLRPDRAPVDDGPAGLVACVTDVDGGVTDVGGAGQDSARVQVVVVDSATGTTVHDVTVDGVLLTAEPVGRDLLLALGLPDGRVRVSRWDLGTGAWRWDHVAATPAQAGQVGAGVAVGRGPDVLRIGDLSLDLATGEEVDPTIARRAPLRYQEHLLPGGARASWSWYPEGRSGRGRITSTGSARTVPLAGPPLVPPLTDTSQPGTLVVLTTRGDRLRGVDLRSGQVRWSRPFWGDAAVQATAQVDGVMVLDDGATVTALDVRTGETLWEASVEPAVTRESALTDGTVVVLPVRDAGALLLEARRIVDGEVVWRAGAPPGTVALAVVDHHLLASTGDEVVGLG
ncbi:PQQ-binding-like beta-propeller repeat protein [Actinotalea sp. K2]|nr:PQQ-binding-like beta-propeller repeat protein [Actinotalea sp. K2]